MHVTGRKPKVFAHYHLYKVAGTTVLRGIRRSVGQENFVELDVHPVHRKVRENGAPYTRSYIEDLVEASPNVRGVTAHFMIADVHFSEKLDVFPIVFVRHPLLRAMSQYRFELENAERRAAIQKAPLGSQVEWMEWCLEQQHHSVRNFQSRILSSNDAGRPKVAKPRSRKLREHLGYSSGPAQPTNEGAASGPASETDIATVFDRLDAAPVVGVVEMMDTSVSRINELGSRFEEGFRLNAPHVNMTKKIADWRAELRAVERSLPGDLVDRFYTNNSDDLALWERYYGRLCSNVKVPPGRRMA